MEARIAILSTAHIHTRGFIRNIHEAGDGRRIAAIWDSVEDRGRRYAAEAGAPFEPDLPALLRRGDVDGFLICAENTRHLDLLEQCLPLGKPVFCEKPLVTTPADLQRVEALLARHDPVLFCGYFMPFGAPMRTVARLLREGFFGTVTRVRVRNAHHAAYGRWFDNPDLAWFHQPELSGGGAFMDMGTHAVHLLVSLFGRVAAAQAVIANHSGVYPDCDDFGVAQLTLASGISAEVEASWTHTAGPSGLEIAGSKAGLWPTAAGYVTGSPGQPPQPLAVSEPAVPDRVDRLVAAIRGEIPAEELRADLAACREAVRVMAACYRAAASGSVEQL